MLLDDLDEAACIERRDVLEHDHAVDFWTAFESSFKNGPISETAYVQRLLPNQKEFQPGLFAKAERFCDCGVGHSGTYEANARSV